MTKKRVLVIDDDMISLSFTRAALSTYYDVLVALQSRDGLMLALNEHPDMILVDISMPKMDGFQLIEQYREEALPEYRATPFIICSSFKSVEFLKRSERLGVEDFLVKPFAPDELLLSTESIFERRGMLTG